MTDRQTKTESQTERENEREAQKEREGEKERMRGGERKRENDLSRWFESQAASCIRRKFVLIALRHFIHLFRLDQII